VNALGHNHPAIVGAIKRQAGRLIHISNLFFHEYQAELAQLLTEISGLDRAFFCNSGTEAWEGALKSPAPSRAKRTAKAGASQRRAFSPWTIRFMDALSAR
jgi:acetylornithine/N-succinyldiaminopimelate aminotransferase